MDKTEIQSKEERKSRTKDQRELQSFNNLVYGSSLEDLQYQQVDQPIEFTLSDSNPDQIQPPSGAISNSKPESILSGDN